MALKKSQLYSSLYSTCDELRGGMDASQYKDYVLVLLFVKYVSDKATSQKGYEAGGPLVRSAADHGAQRRRAAVVGPPASATLPPPRQRCRPSASHLRSL